MNRNMFLTLLIFLVFCGCGIKRNSPIEIVALNYPDDLNVILRSQWGWQPLSEQKANHQITKITIHHSGEDFPEDRDPLQFLRQFQSWSRSEKDWIDIPYHFIIDLKGDIYEARPINYPGDTNTEYDPRGHALICVLGNYEHQIINEQQLEALVRLTTFLAKEFNVPLTEIKGHKDYTDTLCPGKDLYRYLQEGTIQQRVQMEL